MQSIQTHYTINELVSLHLEELPTAANNIRKRVVKENWVARKRVGRGGGVEYDFTSLPIVVQEEIKTKVAASLLKEHAAPALPAIVDANTSLASVSGLTDYQRAIESARLGVLSEVERLMRSARSSKNAAITALQVNAATGDAPQMMALFKAAIDLRGFGKSEQLVPSARTIKRWFAARDSGALAPVLKVADMSVPAWAGGFLKCYQLPQKPSIQRAYDNFASSYDGELPSIHQVRYFLSSKLGNVAKEVGRCGKKSLADIQPFVRRDISKLLAGQVYIADGHAFDAEVINPMTGKPFRPEITVIKDIATDVIVAASASFAESAFSTIAAIREAFCGWGVCAIFYVDNGSGYVNEMMADTTLGIFPRFGVTLKHSLPYNAKAKGKIECLHRTLWVPLAQSYVLYWHDDG